MTTINTEEAIRFLLGDYYLDYDCRVDIANVIKKLDKSDKIKELQERLDCIKKLLDKAYNEPRYDVYGHIPLYGEKGVNQAHRVAAGGELPKRIKG